MPYRLTTGFQLQKSPLKELVKIPMLTSLFLNVKVNLAVIKHKKLQRMQSGGIAPLILNVSTR
jgi:hypothetical protein